MRQELAALAMDAYPDAYAEFRRCMLCFVYGPDAAGSSVHDLWALEQREKAAGQLTRTIRQLKGDDSVRHGKPCYGHGLLYNCRAR